MGGRGGGSEGGEMEGVGVVEGGWTVGSREGRGRE